MINISKVHEFSYSFLVIFEWPKENTVMVEQDQCAAYKNHKKRKGEQMKWDPKLKDKRQLQEKTAKSEMLQQKNI